jgi:CRISPR-associated protein (TIGR02710 family)
MYILLICTVGSSEEPLVASLKHWKPGRTLFITSPGTKLHVREKIGPMALRENVPFDPASHDMLVLEDEQDFERCVNDLRGLKARVDNWVARGDDHQVVVDFTGGTKCMTAALTIQAHRWHCQISYVGGTERNKDGVGVVVSGKEQVLHAQNPWSSLGFQAVQEFQTLFNQCSFAAAGSLVSQAKHRVVNQQRKRELVALETLAGIYDAWDRFDHAGAASQLAKIEGSQNDLEALFGPDVARPLMVSAGHHRKFLRELLSGVNPSRVLVLDLLGNAGRRADEGRWDDAVARLYRAIEALAQWTLASRHAIPSTKAVPLDRIPPPLRAEWMEGKEHRDALTLGLQDAYRLLKALNDPIGDRFIAHQLHDTARSALTARNQSILAHGFERVSKKTFESLWRAALDMADTTDDALPRFPTFPD